MQETKRTKIEGNKKIKKIVVCQIKASPCAPGLAHDKVNSKFRKQSRMKKLPKRKL